MPHRPSLASARHGSEATDGAGGISKAAIEAALEAQIGNPGTDGEVRVQLVALLRRVQVSKGKEVAAAIAEAQGALASIGGGGDADTHTHRMDRLAAIERLIGDTFREHDQYLTEAEKKRLAILMTERDKYTPGSAEWLAMERQWLSAAAQTAQGAAQRAPEGSKARTDLQHAAHASREALQLLVSATARDASYWDSARPGSKQDRQDEKSHQADGDGANKPVRTVPAAPPRIVLASIDATNEALPNLKSSTPGRSLAD
jgi:hypothetical protein